MQCPKCGGGGYVWEGDERSAAGIQKLICSSCNGKGYVSDYSQNPTPVTAWIKCPLCGKNIEVQQVQGGP